VTDRARGWLLVAAQFVLLGALVLTPTGGGWSTPGPLWAIGTAGRLLGAVIIFVGVLQLGRGVSVHPAPRGVAQLRTTGIYRHVRHPIYSGVLVLGAAIAATAGSVVHLILWCALFAVLTVKVRFEERLLADAFPGYNGYARRTGRFLPKLKTTRTRRW
jgi:protein-S-isoprenylcysteine O-methyltransferase Ste14